jgi:nicotinamide-nucleotide amidase
VTSLGASVLAQDIADLLIRRGETLALTETTAGGLVAAHLAAVPGASAWLLGSAVAYSATAKSRWLGLDASSFGADGAVSGPAAALMAEAARQTVGATWGVAETGIAGPQTGRRSRKPVGLCFMAVSGPVARTEELHTGLNDRRANQAAFSRAALALLKQALLDAPRTLPRAESQSTPTA